MLRWVVPAALAAVGDAEREEPEEDDAPEPERRDPETEALSEERRPVIAGGVHDHRTALHLMRTGAAGVIVGYGSAAGATTTGEVLGIGVPMATAIADAAAARRDYLDETGGRYVHVIADGDITTSGNLAKAIACGADAVVLGTPLAAAAEALGGGTQNILLRFDRGDRAYVLRRPPRRPCARPPADRTGPGPLARCQSQRNAPAASQSSRERCRPARSPFARRDP